MNNFVCGQCGSGPMTEREATAHECGVTPPKPTLADLPMDTREAVTILANQLSNINDSLDSLHDVMLALAGQVKELTRANQPPRRNL